MSLIVALMGLIDRLRDTPTAAPAAVTCGDGRQRAIIKDGYKLTDLPTRKTGAAGHAFGDLNSLAGWLKKHSDPAITHVLIGTKEVRAGVDPRDPSADVVAMPWKTHPTLQPWLLAAQHTLSSAELFQLVREQKASIVGDTTKLQASLHTVDVVNSESVQVQLDPATGSIIASGTVGDTKLKGDVPPEITICTPRFLGIRKYGRDVTVTQRVLVRWAHKKGVGLEFSLSLPDLDVVTLEALNAAADVLRGALPDHLVCVGDYAVATHDALPPLAPHLRADRTGGWPPVQPDAAYHFRVSDDCDDCDDGPSAGEAAPPAEPAA